MYNVKEGQLAEVVWEDITVAAGWNDPKEAKMSVMRSFGIVGDVRKKALVLCSGMEGDKIVGDTTIIPWGAIKEIWIYVLES